MANFISGILSITISAIILANVFISSIKTANTTTWTSSETTMWNLLTLVGIVGLVYGVLNVFGIA